jgi:hypothetical protein
MSVEIRKEIRIIDINDDTSISISMGENNDLALLREYESDGEEVNRIGMSIEQARALTDAINELFPVGK